MTTDGICQGCGTTTKPESFSRYCNVESGLTVLYLCPLCHAETQELMLMVYNRVRTPYAHFRNFLPDGAKSDLRTRSP